MESVNQLTTDNFDNFVAGSKGPVVVDFYADWCAPCRMVSPIIEELAREFDGKVRFVKVNIDENPALANRYGVMSIPTIVFIKNEEEVNRIIGAAPERHYGTQVARILEGS
jgi:thioredoxin 1